MNVELPKYGPGESDAPYIKQVEQDDNLITKKTAEDQLAKDAFRTYKLLRKDFDDANFSY